jgi:hypothetical protein
MPRARTWPNMSCSSLMDTAACLRRSGIASTASKPTSTTARGTFASTNSEGSRLTDYRLRHSPPGDGLLQHSSANLLGLATSFTLYVESTQRSAT